MTIFSPISAILRLDRFLDGRAGRVRGGGEGGGVAVGQRGGLEQGGKLADEAAEVLVLGDEVGLAVDLEHGAGAAVGADGGVDHAILGLAVGFFAGFGDAFFAQDVFGGGKVAIGFGERGLAVHHAGVGFFTEFLDE